MLGTANCTGSVQLSVCSNTVDAYAKGNVSLENVNLVCFQDSKKKEDDIPSPKDKNADQSTTDNSTILWIVLFAIVAGIVIFIIQKKQKPRDNDP